jgi:hypothetical protein
MADIKRSSVVGVFPTLEQADQAVKELLQAGFSREDISFAMREEKGEEMKQDAKHYDQVATVRTTEGVVAGGLVGGLIGAVTALVIPGIGGILGAGILIASMAGAGAIGGGFSAMMSLVGVSEEEAEWFKGELEQGRPIVVVQADNRYSEALSILQIHGAYDMSRRKEVEPQPAGPHFHR